MQRSSGLLARIAPGIAALAACAALATAARAATLTIEADRASYHVGETITLTVVGDAEGASALGIHGTLLFDTSLVTWQSTVQQPLTSQGLEWLRGGTAGSPARPFGLCRDQTRGCAAFDQIAPVLAQPATPDNLLLSTITFTAVAPGTVDLTWETDPLTGFHFGFFGMTNAPGTSFAVTTPEPATALLLALGLAGLGRRRPSRR